jgi:hypothetical protein
MLLYEYSQYTYVSNWRNNELGSFYYQTLPHIYFYANISPSVIMHSFTMCTTWTHIMVINTLSMTICMFRLETHWTECDEIWYDYNRIENGRKLTCFETHACFVKINYFVQFWSENKYFCIHTYLLSLLLLEIQRMTDREKLWIIWKMTYLWLVIIIFLVGLYC